MTTISKTAVPSLGAVAALVLAATLAGCAVGLQRAPIEERGGVSRPPTAAASAPRATAPVETPKPAAPNADNAGKPGFYTVKPGDTMIRIGLETGQNWRDIAQWNGIDNPNQLEVGQVLRVVPPGIDPNAAATRAVPTTRVESRPLDARPAPAASAPVATPAPAAPREPDSDVTWAWPSSAAITVPFDESRNKGALFAGRAGDPVFAAADGRVVYAGAGLRGYGNFVIVKHNSAYLSVYAHNQTLLVKEDQPVRRGQKIAEMGSSDAERVQLHFEIRRQGKPVDPARLMPPR